MIENYEYAFEKTDLDYDDNFIKNNQKIINQYKQYDNDIFKESNELIDLFCIQLLREIPNSFIHRFNFYIEGTLSFFLNIIDELKIDFTFFVVISGEEYLNSDFYDLESESEDKKINILNYLLNKNYNNIVKLLINHYETSENLLLNILENTPYKKQYFNLIHNDYYSREFEYTDLMKIRQWEDEGFPMYGE